MKCIEVEKQIDSLLDGEVSSVIREEVEHHFKECRICGQTHEKLRAVNELLMKPIPVPDPKRLDEFVMDAFYRLRQSCNCAGKQNNPKNSRRDRKKAGCSFDDARR